jgi:hypothetical protein
VNVTPHVNGTGAWRTISACLRPLSSTGWALRQISEVVFDLGFVSPTQNEFQSILANGRMPGLENAPVATMAGSGSH